MLRLIMVLLVYALSWSMCGSANAATFRYTGICRVSLGTDSQGAPVFTDHMEMGHHPSELQQNCFAAQGRLISRQTQQCHSGMDFCDCGNYDIHELDLKADHGWELCSGYRFLFRRDGNLVLYSPTGEPVWASNTSNKGATVLKMQKDGNLVIYGASGPLWATNTSGHKDAFLSVQEDGNVVIYTKDKHPIWSVR